MSDVFEWDGYCTRCHHGVSWDGDDHPDTEREAVCHECDRALCREEGARAQLEACIRAVEAIVIPTGPTGQPATYVDGAVGMRKAVLAALRGGAP